MSRRRFRINSLSRRPKRHDVRITQCCTDYRPTIAIEFCNWLTVFLPPQDRDGLHPAHCPDNRDIEAFNNRLRNKCLNRNRLAAPVEVTTAGETLVRS